MTYRKLCWPFPQRCCFLGDCKLCKESTYEVDLDRLMWMASTLHFQVGQSALARTFS